MARKPPKYQDKVYNTRLKPRSENQREYIKSVKENDIVFCGGPAGSGKTFIAVASAVKALNSKQIEKIIITRPVVEAGESLGFLPGTADEKLKPYLLPIIDEFLKFVSHSQLEKWKKEGVLEIVPLALMRGRNFHGSFMIGDEFQNATFEQVKMFLTRIGMGSKAVITGDQSQSDLPENQRGSFVKCLKKLTNIDGIGIIELDKEDIVRNALIPIIIDKLKD